MLLAPQLVNWTFPEEAPQFVSLSDHCAYRQLLHLPGNSYAGRYPTVGVVNLLLHLLGNLYMGAAGQGRAGLCLRCDNQCHVQGLRCVCCAVPAMPQRP